MKNRNDYQELINEGLDVVDIEGKQVEEAVQENWRKPNGIPESFKKAIVLLLLLNLLISGYFYLKRNPDALSPDKAKAQLFATFDRSYHRLIDKLTKHQAITQKDLEQFEERAKQ